jgi:hypothetical protein
VLFYLLLSCSLGGIEVVRPTRIISARPTLYGTLEETGERRKTRNRIAYWKRSGKLQFSENSEAYGVSSPTPSPLVEFTSTPVSLKSTPVPLKSTPRHFIEEVPIVVTPRTLATPNRMFANPTMDTTQYAGKSCVMC